MQDVLELANPQQPFDAEVLKVCMLEPLSSSTALSEYRIDILNDHSGYTWSFPRLRELHITSHSPLKTVPTLSRRPAVTAAQMEHFINTVLQRRGKPVPKLVFEGVRLGKRYHDEMRHLPRLAREIEYKA
ncbi:hypothetical protein AURDEDRAFT_170859 [Auricularia subglabra TFB-10046 SS5]|nr:hypothetical protein AURDEDRAFT_170859 [Auricularia subglabra TFB-10046 SS5]